MADIHSVSRHLAYVTGLTVQESVFEFVNEEGPHETLFSEEVGYFVPRELKGYVFPDAEESESTRRIAHEISHGMYSENVPAGKIIVNGDRSVSDAEIQLFGRLLKKDEKVLILTDRDLSGFARLAN